jgi:hypothetical protein
MEGLLRELLHSLSRKMEQGQAVLPAINTRKIMADPRERKIVFEYCTFMLNEFLKLGSMKKRILWAWG